MTVTWVDTVVFGPAAGPVTYTQLSLGVLYADKLVYLKFKSADAAHYVAVKPGAGSSGIDPHPEIWHEWATDGICGTNEFACQHADDCAILAVTADDLGNVRWITEVGSVWTVTLMVAQDVTLVWGGAYHTGAAPGTWTAKDLSALMGAVDRLIWSKCVSATPGSVYYTHRYNGDPLGTSRGLYEATHNDANIAQGILSMAVSGIIDHIGNDTLDVYLGCYSDNWTNTIAHALNPIYDGPAPIVETNLDLSPIVGAQRVIALVKIVGTTSPRGSVYMKPKGDIDNYAPGVGNPGTGAAYPFGCCGSWPYGYISGWGTYQIVFTDTDGVCQWKTTDSNNMTVTVLGYDAISANVGPTLTPTAPVGTVIPGAAITWSTSDPDDGDDQTKAILNLTDPSMNVHNAVVAGAVQAGFSGGATPNTSGGFDWSITVDGGMDSGAWSAYAYCEDFTGVSDDDTWGPWTVEYEELYCNQVWDTIEGRYVQWLSSSGYDVGGASYPYPAHWPADVSNYEGKGIYLPGLTPSLSYRNQVWDEVAVAFVLWVTVGAYDITGAGYPGPGVWGVTTNSYVGRGHYS